MDSGVRHLRSQRNFCRSERRALKTLRSEMAASAQGVLPRAGVLSRRGIITPPTPHRLIQLPPHSRSLARSQMSTHRHGVPHLPDAAERLYHDGRQMLFASHMRNGLSSGGAAVHGLLSALPNDYQTTNGIEGVYVPKPRESLAIDQWHTRKKDKDSLTRYLEDAIIRDVNLRASGHG